jgi:hypothetical protein
MQRLPGADLPSTVRLLDLLCQPNNSNARIRFFFHLHDSDADGIWNTQDVYGVVDSLLWLFIGKGLWGAEERERIQVVANCLIYEITGPSMLQPPISNSPPMVSSANGKGRFMTSSGEASDEESSSTLSQQWWHDIVRAVIEKEDPSGIKKRRPSIVVNSSDSGSSSSISNNLEESVVRCIIGLIEQFIRLHQSATNSSGPSKITSLTATETLSPLSNSSSFVPSGTVGLFVCHPRYKGIIDAVCRMPSGLRIGVQDFLTIVLGEPLLVEFFDKRGEL